MFAELKAEFPRGAISWRAQSLNKEGTSAMALAYIDARDVMARLDDVCGPAGWQCRYPHAGAKTVCEIGVWHNDQWIWKADGAGDSDIEAEKGALSDAFKRAAVRWGIGRYLYDLASPWVGCEHYVNGKGNKVWKRWTQDPWTQVRTPSAPIPGRDTAPPTNGSTSNVGGAVSSPDAELVDKAMRMAAAKAQTQDDLRSWWAGQVPKAKAMLSPEAFEDLKQHVAGLAPGLPEKAAA
jgi:hypothetical protein